ncbi:MAG: hypothetical protein ACJ798_05490 [Phenylobacterium sp.]
MAPSKSGAKGLDLEEALRAYFYQAGYYVARGVPYRLEGEDITDVDLWLYERPAATTRRRMIIDVKNKRSPKATERLIWVKGLQAALAVDGAIVATTDRRESTRRFARSLGVTLLDGDAVARLTNSDQLREPGQFTAEEFDDNVKRIDGSRRSSDWRDELFESRSALLHEFGVQSANRNLTAAGYFASQAVGAQPDSRQSEMACRLSFLAASMAAISLDFVLAGQAFRPHEEVRSAIVAAIRFGQSEAVSSLTTVRAAIGLARAYADNGGAVARQIEQGFLTAAEDIQAELIADFVSRTSTADTLFTVARELQSTAFSVQMAGFDKLSTEAKGYIGVLLDFSKVSRARFAQAWSGGAPTQLIRGGTPSARNVPYARSAPRSLSVNEPASPAPKAPTDSPTPLFDSSGPSQTEPGELG